MYDRTVMHNWVAIGISTLALVLAVNGYFDGRERRAQLDELRGRADAAEVERMLDSAWDILGGRPFIAAINTGGFTHDQQRLTEADRIIRRAQHLFPEHPRVAKMRGSWYHAKGNLEKALSFYEAAIARDATYIAAHNNRANVLRSLGRLEDALQGYETAISLRPQDTRLHINRGNVLLDLGRFDDALSAYGDAKRIEPTNAVSSYSKGLTYRRMGDLQSAVREYEDAIRIAPHYVDAHFNLGFVLDMLKRFEEALRAFDRVIEIDPADAEAHSYRCRVLYELARLDDALEACDAALRIDAQYESALRNRELVITRKKELESD